MVQFLASNTFLRNLAKIQMQDWWGATARHDGAGPGRRRAERAEDCGRFRECGYSRSAESSPHIFSVGASNHAAHQTPRYFSRFYCDATLRATISSFSRTMLLVNNSGKTIGSSLFPG